MQTSLNWKKSKKKKKRICKSLKSKDMEKGKAITSDRLSLLYFVSFNHFAKDFLIRT